MLVEPFSLAAVEELVSHIFGEPAPRVSRVGEGVSTYVYRLQRRDDLLYLRVLPEQDASFAPEVFAHRLLRDCSVRVPDVVYWEHRNELLGHSVMITTAMPGTSIDQHTPASERRAVLAAAGRDLARINNVPVDGYGWIRRDNAVVTHLQAEQPTLRALMRDPLDANLDVLGRAGILQYRELAAISEIAAQLDHLFDCNQARLAHGDFDAIHIFGDNGEYSGIIDFGEIRGADPFYDLGHFQIENGDNLPYLLEGYAAETNLPADFAQRIWLWSMLIALRRLARRATRQPQAPVWQPDIIVVRKALGELAMQ